MTGSTIDLYKKYYGSIQFDRANLFKLIKETYNCSEVLYPGCFIHITPSFFFPHVVYVDRNPDAVKFFADMDGVLQFINHNKNYKRTPYVRFIAQDYTTAMPLEDRQFDLVLSLYAGGISRVCKKYLKIGGILLTHNFQNEAGDAAADASLQLIAAIRFHKKAYTLIEDSPDTILSLRGKAKTKRVLKQTSSGVECSENEDYFIFRRYR
jgi:hypothetical protein